MSPRVDSRFSRIRVGFTVSPEISPVVRCTR